jgi:hemolysin activation/secretion protein
VVPQGNKHYPDDTLARPFEPLIGQLVTLPRTENALLTLTKYPGLAASGLFRPGNDVGSTDMVINVQQERAFDGSVTADNSGTAFTGRRRVIGIVDWNDPTGAADLAQLTALKTFQPKNAWFGDLRYQHPVVDAYDNLAFDLSRNTFDVSGGNNFTPGVFGGISKIAIVSLDHDFKRSRETNVIATFDLSRKRADTFFEGTLQSRDDLAVLGAQLNYDNVNAATSTISTAYLRLDRGFAGVFGVPTTAKVTANPPQLSVLPVRKDSNGVPASPAFTRLTMGYQLYKSLPFNEGLLFRFAGQYSPDLLSSLEQFVIGGPDSVRAIPTSQFLVDTGAFVSLEYSVAAPGFADKHAFSTYNWGQVLRFKLFVDSADGIVHDSLVRGGAHVNVNGVGVGLEFDIPGSLTSDIRYSRLNGGARGSNTTGDPNAIPFKSQFWAGVTYNF